MAGDITKFQAKQTESERIELAKRAGAASGVARREKKLLKDVILEIIELKAPGRMKDKLYKKFPGMKDFIEQITIQQAMVLSMIDQAVNKGNIRAFDSLRDTAGQKPIDKVAQTDPTGEEGLTITFVNGGYKVKQPDESDNEDKNNGK